MLFDNDDFFLIFFFWIFLVVTTCSQAAEAIFLLQENHGFDLIMADVCMTDMDGFKLFELAGFNMHLPIISK